MPSEYALVNLLCAGPRVRTSRSSVSRRFRFIPPVRFSVDSLYRPTGPGLDIIRVSRLSPDSSYTLKRQIQKPTSPAVIRCSVQLYHASNINPAVFPLQRLIPHKRPHIMPTARHLPHDTPPRQPRRFTLLLRLPLSLSWDLFGGRRNGGRIAPSFPEPHEVPTTSHHIFVIRIKEYPPVVRQRYTAKTRGEEDAEACDGRWWVVGVYGCL